MIPEAVLLDALQAVHTGRLRVHEAYRTIRAAEEDNGITLTRQEAREIAAELNSQAAISTRPGQLHVLSEIAKRFEVTS